MSYGQLGDGTTAAKSATPVDVVGLGSGVKALAARGYHTCALTGDGGVKCWGMGLMGQLGDGGTALAVRTPVEAAGLASGVATITAGTAHTCAVTTGGGAQCWGSNNSGRLGDGTTTDRTTPVDVIGLESGVAGIAGGGYHTCAVTSGGGAKCWGNGGYGQLGDGATTRSSIPRRIAGLTGSMVAVSTGSSHACALSEYGGVFCWGANAEGQLGNGSTNSSGVPVAVTGLGNGVQAIAARAAIPVP